MELQMAAYGAGLAGLAVLVLIVLVQSLMVGIAKPAAGLTPGDQPKGDYESLIYRTHRVHQNSVEALVPFAATALAAILIGVIPWLVNVAVWLHVLLRLGFWVVYRQNVGKPVNGLRSMVFALGWLLNVILALAVLIAWVA